MRDKVRDHYGLIARMINDSKQPISCGCGDSCCSITGAARIYDPEDISSLPSQAVNASLGCANPLILANLQEGEVVLDLGSGGGIDALIASQYVGKTGKVYGLDMTDEMLELANANKERMGVENVEFLKGYMEEIPLADASVDVVVSNCVVNLSDDKEAVMREIYRVLKPGGRLAIADIVRTREVPTALQDMVALWVGCFAGALSIDEFKSCLDRVGFNEISVTPEFIYGKEVLGNMDGRLTDEEWLALDGAFAGALVKASK
ncbi:MAG: arsenite methyltransferase [Bacillota bacterium]